MEENKAEVKTSAANAQQEGQRYLFVSVNGVEYGIEIERVDEIIVMQEISPIPSTKPFCKGVINIRGTIIPVIDLRIKMGLPSCEYTEDACIVVVMIQGERIGVIVEAVQDVLMLQASQIQESPATGSAANKGISSKIAKIDGAVKQIIDLYKVFDLEPEGESQQAAE
jgi:Chemotaxis signal transduction protein